MVNKGFRYHYKVPENNKFPALSLISDVFLSIPDVRVPSLQMSNAH